MSDDDFSLLSDEEKADLERARRLIADEEWIAHFAYLDRLKADIRALDTARSEQRIRRAHLHLIKGGRRDAR